MKRKPLSDIECVGIIVLVLVGGIVLGIVMFLEPALFSNRALVFYFVCFCLIAIILRLDKIEKALKKSGLISKKK